MTSLFFTLIWEAYYRFGFERGTRVFRNDESINLVIVSCSLFIYDHSMISSLSLDTNFLGVKHIPSSLESDEYAFLQFVYPKAPALLKDSTFAESYSGGVKTFEFVNTFTHDSCEIAIYLYKPTKFAVFNIDCGANKQCNIVINSHNFMAASMDIKG